MSALLAAHRVYFLVVSGFTAWVGFFGFFRPEQILRALSWPVPPLHARFIGALYLSATAFLLLAMLQRHLAAMRAIVLIALAWTGWLLVVTLVHLDSFDFRREQVWFWFVAYVAFPIAAAALAWRSARAAPAAPATAITQGWVVTWLRAQGLALVATAAALFLFPAWVVSVWPWKVSPLLSQLYSGPVLGYGVGSLWLAARPHWEAAAVPTIGMLVFAVLALIGSVLHLGAFTLPSASATLWFATLALLASASAAVLAMAVLALRGGDDG